MAASTDFSTAAIVFLSYLGMIRLTEYFSLLSLMDLGFQMLAYERPVGGSGNNFCILWYV